MEEKPYKPEAITLTERLLDYWFAQLLEEQKKTNELLHSLVSKDKPKTTRKKKEGE